MSTEQETIRLLQEELAATDRGVLALVQEFEGRIERCAAEAVAAGQSKGIALASLAQEIRTPLEAVLAGARRLLEGPLDPRQQGTAEAIQRAGGEILALVGRVLALGTAADGLDGHLVMATEPSGRFGAQPGLAGDAGADLQGAREAAGLAPDQLAGVPAGLRAELRAAVMVADYQRVLQVIDRIQAVHPRAAATLRAQARRFAYQALLDGLAGGR